MSAPAPAKKYTIIKIQERLSQGHPLSEFELAALEKEARKELAADPQNGLAALGVLACLRGDIDGLRKHHQKAIALSNQNPMQIFNYASSLNHCGLHEEALELAEQMYSQDPTFMEALYLIILALYHLGRMKEAALRLKEWEAKTHDEHPCAQDIIEDLEDEEDLRLAREQAKRGEVVPWDKIKAELGLS